MGYVETVGTTIIGITCRDQAEIGTAVGVGGSMVSLFPCQLTILLFENPERWSFPGVCMSIRLRSMAPRLMSSLKKPKKKQLNPILTRWLAFYRVNNWISYLHSHPH
jgi:hypothetical protein